MSFLNVNSFFSIRKNVHFFKRVSFSVSCKSYGHLISNNLTAIEFFIMVPSGEYAAQGSLFEIIIPHNNSYT